MEHTFTHLKRSHLLILLFAVFFSQFSSAQAVTEIITDYTGYWKSGAGALNPVKPQNSHDLLSFTYNGIRYSTGVNDALLTTRGDAFSAQKFMALSLENMSGIPTAETFIGVGQLYDGVNNGPSSPPPLNNLPYYLTDGVQGLNIGTCATNIPQGYVSFDVSQVNPTSIGDGIPDILITQVAQPSGATDIYSFKDINGNTVGSSVNIVLNNLTPVGNWIADFYRVNSNPMIIPAGFVNTERPMRLWAADFSDFGITAGNYANIDHFVINLKGTTDIAFIAYNFATAVVVPITSGISLLKEGTFIDSNNDCRASIGDTVQYTFKVTNTGQAPLTQVTITDPNVAVSGGPINLAAGASNTTAFTATYNITQADIDAGVVYNQARVSARNPENEIVANDSKDPTPIGSSSPLFNPACPDCTVTPLLRTPTVSVTLPQVTLEGCGTAAITGLVYSETEVSITPAQFIAAGGTISNISLVLNIKYSDTQSGTCPVTVTRTFSVTSGCLIQRATQTFVIRDTTAPTATAPAAITLTGCNGTFPAADITLITDEADNCGTAPVVTFVNDSTPVLNGCTETTVRTYRVTDACGNFTDLTQNLIRTADTVAPTASNPADIILVGNDPIPAADVAVVTDEADNCGAPTVAFVSDSTPVTTDCSETVIRTYSVTDACGNTINVTQNIIRNSNTAAPLTGAVTQPTCTVGTGSVVLTGLPTGNWTINPGNIQGSGATFTVTDLNPGTYNFTYTAEGSGCTSNPSATVTININPGSPATPTAVVTQPTCTMATGTVVLSGLPTGNWTINPGNITGTGSETTLTLPSGLYDFSVTNAEGCISGSVNVTINAQPTAPSVPTAVVTQPTCTVATGTVVLSGLPTGAWTISPINVSGTGSTATIELATGSYDLTVSSEGCSSVSFNVTVNAQPTAPSVPTAVVTQPTCTVATGSVVLSGLPTGNWTINPGNITGSGSTTTLTLAAGSYDLTVSSEGCTSAAFNVTISAQPASPSVPTAVVTQPTCTVATGSVTLSGLPTGAWTISPINVSGTGSTATIELAAGSYDLTVTSEGCSSASFNVTVNTQPTGAAAPVVVNITQPTCALATASVEFSGLVAGTVLNPGNIQITASGSYTVTGLASGVYNFNATTTEGCASASVSVTINAQPSAPAAPTAAVTQPTCQVATASVVFSGLPTGSWTINPGAITGSSATFSIGSLAAGDYTYTVTNADGCESAAVTFTVTAAGGNIQNVPVYAECNNDNAPQVRINLVDRLPGGVSTGGTWNSTDPRLVLVNDSTVDPYLVPVGDYNVEYTVVDGSCTQKVVFAVKIDDECPVEPAAACPIRIHNAFSPNGDGINDVFEIENLQDRTCFPTNSIEIYNRWGVLVYETKQYDNTTNVFRGISEGRATLSKSAELPVGTYFYILKYYNTATKKNEAPQGYIYLTK